MIDRAEANETHRAASAIAAFDAIQVAFAALVKKGILSKAEVEQILRQAIETIKTGGTSDQAAELLFLPPVQQRSHWHRWCDGEGTSRPSVLATAMRGNTPRCVSIK